jgi:type II secretory pathway component GspD/PulD (secretin)
MKSYPICQILAVGCLCAVPGVVAQETWNAPVALPAAPFPVREPAEVLALPALIPPAPAKGTGLPELSLSGYWIENSPINELFQYLARAAELQFFNNNELTDPRYLVTGHLKLTDPIVQMEELALVYGLTVYRQGNTIQLMTDQQLSRLPVQFMAYQLRYLRGAGSARVSSSGGDASGAAVGADFEKLRTIIKPMLTREGGQIEFEEKTNTLLVTDNNVKLQKVREVLQMLDQPKKQIVINVRILRVRKSRATNVGVDWSAALGGSAGAGVPLNISQSLNGLFNLPDTATLSSAGTTVANNGQGIVFDAIKVQAILRALKERDLVTQESCPTVITEDNEQGIISFVDRFPVITSTVASTAAGLSTTDKVRYKIDEEDASSVDKPDKSREIGVTLSVTPTLLPDGTVRMRLRPRVANVVELVTGKSGNVFPRVSESTVEGISRIPSGQSLFLGGFYDSSEKGGNKKVPILGSIPLVGGLFSSRNKSAEQVSLVFIITPSVYDASSRTETGVNNNKVRTNSGFNRINPLGEPTPVLPDPSAANGYLPLPAEPAPKKRTAPTPRTPKPQSAEAAAAAVRQNIRRHP